MSISPQLGSRPVEIQVKQVSYRRGISELKDLETIRRRIRRSQAHFPDCSSEIKLRSFEWVFYRKRKWQVRFAAAGWELILPSEWELVLPGKEMLLASGKGFR